MSGDIVERLEGRAETLGWLNEQDGTREILLEAAEVIEQLRADLAAERDEVERLTDRIATLCTAGDALADSLQRSEEQFYAHWFEEGVVNEKVREYVSGHSALAAFKEARREQ